MLMDSVETQAKDAANSVAERRRVLEGRVEEVKKFAPHLPPPKRWRLLWKRCPLCIASLTKVEGDTYWDYYRCDDPRCGYDYVEQIPKWQWPI